MKGSFMLIPRGNELLAHLTDAEIRPIYLQLQLINLTEGQQLYGVGDLVDQVYFPVTALIAIAKEMPEGVGIDLALVGKDGAVGFRGLISRCPNRIYVSVSGSAYKIGLKELEQIKQHQINVCDPLQIQNASSWLTKMHAQAFEQISASMTLESTCAHFHNISQRLARWLLTRYERSNVREIPCTHQRIADSMGVRREGVTSALQKLQGLQLHRSKIEIRDVAQLEVQCCDCYRTAKLRTEQLRLPLHS
jgi:CRP-like cAMP-binding protein